jgi:hypothetical protein
VTRREPEPQYMPRYPKGTPEYAAYEAELKEELRKWAAGEPPYVSDVEGEPYNPFGKRNTRDLGLTEEDAELLLRHLNEDKEEKA